MRRILFGGIFILCLSLGAASHGGDKSAPKLPPPPTTAALEMVKKLAGTWLLADQDGKPTDQIASIIKVTAGGSAVHETLFPGQPHEMVSIYTVEGSDLVMTHYCVLGNQPRIKADPKSPANQIVWRFAGGANLDPKKSQLNILVVTAKFGLGQPNQVCNILQLDTSTLSRNVERMRAKGWLEVVPGEDARTQSFRPTVQGKRLLEQAVPAWEEAQGKAAELLGEDGVALLTRTVSKLGLPRTKP